MNFCNSLLLAIALAMCSLLSAAEQKRFLSESDVLFTQPLSEELSAQNYGKYGKYQVDTTMWGFLPPTFADFDAQNGFDQSMKTYVKRILEHENAKVNWVSRIEWDVIWQGMTTKYPQNYQKAMVKRLDGSSLEIDWFPGHFYFSTHAPLFKDYIEWQIKDVAFYGESTSPEAVDALLFDSQHTSPAQYQLGGGFGEDCQNNFKLWLTDKYSTEELAVMGIDYIDEFHYGSHLLTLGYTVDTYEAATMAGDNIPLGEAFKLFLQEWNNDYLADLVKFSNNIAKEKGYPKKDNGRHIDVGTSSPILDPYFKGIRFAPIDEFDFYVQEFNHKAPLGKVSSDVMLMYKIAEALAKPLALTGQPYPDWNYMVDNPQATDLVRAWIAQAYANGAVFMAPDHMWSYNNQQQRYYDVQSGDYDYIYRWIAENKYLFDKFESVAKVGLVYSHSAYRKVEYNQLDVFSAAAGLMENNIPYKLLIAGDDWWPKYLTDADQSSQIKNYQVIVQTEFNGYPLDDKQKAVLDANATKQVAWPNLTALQKLLPTEISVSTEGIASFPRVNVGFPHKNPPHIIHLVNRYFDKQSVSIKSKKNFVVTVADSLFGKAMVTARYNQAGEKSVTLSVSRNNGITTINVPKLDNWGIIELFTNETIPDKTELSADCNPLPSSSLLKEASSVIESSTSSGGSFIFWHLIFIVLILIIRTLNTRQKK